MGAEFWAAIWGAIVGSLLGGAISYFLQMTALREARTQNTQLELERKQVLARSLLFKLIQIFSHLHRFNSHVAAAIAAAEAAGIQPLTWERLVPLANMPMKVSFSSEEMAMLLALKNDELFNAIVSSDELHNSTIDVFELYSIRRLDLTDQLPAALANGNQGAQIFHGQFIELNMLIQQIEAKTQPDEDAAWRCLEDFNQEIASKLSIHITLKPKAEI